MDIATGGKTLLLEQAGYLHLLDPGESRRSGSRSASRPTCVEARPRFVKGAKYVRDAGDLAVGRAGRVRVPRRDRHRPGREGRPAQPDQHRRASTSAARPGRRTASRSPTSPTRAASTSCTSAPPTARATRRPTTSAARASTSAPSWSPDWKKIAFVDNSHDALLDRPRHGQGDEDRVRAALRAVRAVAAAAGLVAGLEVDRLHPRQQGRVPHGLRLRRWTTDKSTAVTDGLSDCVDPVFDASGKYLYFLASTDAGPVEPVVRAVERRHADQARRSYLVVLKKGVPSPLAKESDEEKADAPKPKAEPKDEEGRTEEGRRRSSSTSTASTSASSPLPIPAGELSQPAGRRGRADLTTWKRPRRRGDGPAGGTLHRFDLTKRKSETVARGVADYTSAAGRQEGADREHRRVGTRLTDRTDTRVVDHRHWPDAPDRAAARAELKLDAVEVRIDPRAEWKQIFDEAWRINRDYFYDPEHARGRLEGDQGRSTRRSCRTWRRAAT